ncbi:MAG: hypothetical protein ACJAR8_002044, partial [Bacteroidia bacterium]
LFVITVLSSAIVLSAATSCVAISSTLESLLLAGEQLYKNATGIISKLKNIFFMCLFYNIANL